MGFLGILKKKEKGKLAGLTLVNQNPEQLKKEFLGVKSDIPPIGDIPLPPRPDNFSIPSPEETMSGFEPISSISEPKQVGVDKINNPPIPEDTFMPEVGDSLDDIIPEPTTLDETSVSSFPEEEEKKDDNFDFSLPDFSEDELNVIGEKAPIEETSIEPEKEEIEPLELTPILKAVPVNKKGHMFMNVGECRKIFEKIDLNQEVLKSVAKTIQTRELKNKTTLQNYKNFHDTLDLMQEKLMQIDSSLFER